MVLDEAALETLGLAPLWVRRGMRAAPAATGGAGGARGDMPTADDATPTVPTHVGASSDAGNATPARAAVAPDVGTQPPAFDEAEPFDAARMGTPAGTGRRPADGTDGAASNAASGAADVHTLGWDALEARVAACERCRLCEKRTQAVFGVGDREADWMLIGEAPGENEDKLGEPFVGQAGKLLDSMLHALALALARGRNVYIANVVKCRPPGNRNPEPDEVARCEPYLQRQVALVKPKLIVALGRVAAQNLLKTDASISSLRGRIHRYEDVPVVVTYHPAYLLRSLPDKAKAWVDLCLARETYRQTLTERTDS
jgi:uracil-DNA glycosylase